MRADALPELDGNTLLCIQAGNVNTGAFDPAVEICQRARSRGLDSCGWRVWFKSGGFALVCALDSAGLRQRIRGQTDGHKWPNVGYDCGIAIVAAARKHCARR